MIERVYQYIQRYHLIPEQSTVVVGFSGGPDSVFLLYQLVALRERLSCNIIAAHFNHGWRIPASDEDMFFCQQLAARLNIVLRVGRPTDFPDIVLDGSQESYGRQLRRAFFGTIIKELQGPCVVALGHHFDDQVETFFIRLMRGAGLEGLASMQPQTGYYARPLLELQKREILAYLQGKSLAYCVDSTNLEGAYLRNRLRNSGIPAIASCDSRFLFSMEKTLQNLQEAELYIEQVVEQTWNEISVLHDSKPWLLLEKFFDLHPFLQKRVLVYWFCVASVPFTLSQGLLEEIIRFLRYPVDGQHLLYAQWIIIKKSGRATIKNR